MLQGAGLQDPITLSIEEYTGSEIEQDEFTYTVECNGNAGYYRTDCYWTAHRGSVEIPYTIYWTHADPTRGVYKGEGWLLDGLREEVCTPEGVCTLWFDYN